MRGWEGTADSSMIDLAAICPILGAIPNNSTTSNPNQAVIDFAELSVSFRSITIILGVRQLNRSYELPSELFGRHLFRVSTEQALEAPVTDTLKELTQPAAPPTTNYERNPTGSEASARVLRRRLGAQGLSRPDP
jgi:hypothetical protein